MEVISSCFDLRALPLGNSVRERKLGMFLAFRTLLSTRRMMTSDTVNAEYIA